jgi:hypothetical protein
MIPLILRRPFPWAAAAPLLCAAHCLAAQLLALNLPALAADEELERVLFAVSAAFALAATVRGVRRHGRGRIWIPVAGGIALWAASLAGWLAPLPEAATSMAGSLAVAGGLLWNGRLRHLAVCPGCGCPASPADKSVSS